MAPESLIYFVCSLGVGGSLLAAGGLAVETRLGRRWGQRWSASSAAALALAALAAAWAGAPAALWGSMLTLAAAAAVAWTSRVRLVRRGLVRLCNANTVWLTLLVAAPAATWWLLGASAGPPCESFDGIGLDPAGSADLVRKVDQTVQGQTDRGRIIRLFAFETAQPLEELEDAMLTAHHYARHVIQIAEPSRQSNCHGWVFAGGRFGVPSEQVEEILADNSYQRVDAPRENDVVVYRNSDGEITHTGEVQMVSHEGLVLVESKWGPWGVFLHPVAVQPYGENFGFYRTARPNHLLKIVAAAADEPGEALADEEEAAASGRVFETAVGATDSH